MTGSALGQNLVLNDSMILVRIKDPDKPGISLARFQFTSDLEYSFTCSNLLFFNQQQKNNDGQISLLQNLRYRSQISSGKHLKITGSWVHDLGIQFFFDSISRFNPDINTLDTKVEIKQGKRISIFVSSRLTTRIFNSYDYETDASGGYTKTLNSAFLTPLICLFSAGLGWKNPRIAEISLGLSGAKLTYIRDKKIYTQLQVNQYYGVPDDRDYIIEYGLSLQILIDQNILQRVQWNCDLQLFKNYRKPVDFILKNRIGILITKHLKGSIQTRLQYEEQVSRKLQLENMISAGLSLQF